MASAALLIGSANVTIGVALAAMLGFTVGSNLIGRAIEALIGPNILSSFMYTPAFGGFFLLKVLGFIFKAWWNDWFDVLQEWWDKYVLAPLTRKSKTYLVNATKGKKIRHV